MTDSKLIRSPSTLQASNIGDSSLLNDDGGATSTHRFLIPSEANQQIATEVNEYLSRAIDARNVERLKNEEIHPITLKFRDASLEKKVNWANFINKWSYVIRTCV